MMWTSGAFMTYLESMPVQVQPHHNWKSRTFQYSPDIITIRIVWIYYTLSFNNFSFLNLKKKNLFFFPIMHGFCVWLKSWINKNLIIIMKNRSHIFKVKEKNRFSDLCEGIYNKIRKNKKFNENVRMNRIKYLKEDFVKGKHSVLWWRVFFFYSFREKREGKGRKGGKMIWAASLNFQISTKNFFYTCILWFSCFFKRKAFLKYMYIFLVGRARAYILFSIANFSHKLIYFIIIIFFK